MVSFAASSLSLILGVTFGCTLGFRLQVSQLPNGTNVGGRFRRALFTFVALATGAIVGALFSYLGQVVFVLVDAALQSIFTATQVVGTTVCILTASAIGGFMAAFAFPAVTLTIVRPTHAAILTQRWLVPASAGIGFGFIVKFAPSVGAALPFSVVLGIVSGLVTALACALTQRSRSGSQGAVTARS
jgi:hypothetical protein